MNGRGKILERLRRWARGSGRSVLGLAAVAYVAAGIAPCVAAASSATDAVNVAREQTARVHAHSAVHERGSAAAGVPSSHHDHGGGLDAGAASSDSGGRHCPHCPVGGGAVGIVHDDGHSSCAALEDVAQGAAPQAKETLQTAALLLGPVTFAWPPPLASPLTTPRPSHSMRSASVPLNVWHCVYLI